VVNRLAGSMSNNSKGLSGVAGASMWPADTPYAGVPMTPKRAHDRFYEECQGDVIYKSLSGIRSIVRRIGP